MTLTYNPKTQEWEGTTGGVNLQELGKRKPAPKVVPQKENKAEQIEKEILGHPIYGYIKRLSIHIAEQYEIGFKANSFIFRNKTRATYYPNSHQIVYGYENAQHIFENGFAEYPTVAHVWWGVVKMEKRHDGRQSYYKMLETGKIGLWQVVLHEMAHFIDKGENGHQSRYQEILKELIILFPYEEVKGI